jgi:hypothetical protein
MALHGYQRAANAIHEASHLVVGVVLGWKGKAELFEPPDGAKAGEAYAAGETYFCADPPKDEVGARRHAIVDAAGWAGEKLIIPMRFLKTVGGAVEPGCDLHHLIHVTAAFAPSDCDCAAWMECAKNRAATIVAIYQKNILAAAYRLLRDGIVGWMSEELFYLEPNEKFTAPFSA